MSLFKAHAQLSEKTIVIKSALLFSIPGNYWAAINKWWSVHQFQVPIYSWLWSNTSHVLNVGYCSWIVRFNTYVMVHCIWWVKARKIANNSQKFIWLVDSREIHLPSANLPLKYAHQPFFDASVSMQKSIGLFLIDFSFNFSFYFQTTKWRL